MSEFVDARTLPAGTVLTPDIAIVGGGPAGISLAMALANNTKLDLLLLESGSANFDPAVQALYTGSQSGDAYAPLEVGRLRTLGGGTNHWGGWSRPLDAIDFEKRDWVPHSGWPFPKAALDAYYPIAQNLIEAGPWIYDKGDSVAAANAPMMPLGEGGLYTSWFQFSKMRGDVVPTRFGARYEGSLKAAANIKSLLNANVTAVRLTPNAQQVDRLDAATLNPEGGIGKRFTIRPRHVVMAAGGMENARLLLASNDVMKAGVGNQNDLVGRFFGDNPIPRNVATLVVFGGKLASYYGSTQTLGEARMRAVFAPTAAFARSKKVMGSLTTLEYPVELDDIGKAAVITAANALGVDASSARAYSVGCGMELLPDRDRRLTLTGETDALGLPRLKLHNIVSDADFALYRQTLAELGRQVLASGAGLLRINCSRREDWLKNMDWGHHHLGTVRMHVDPRQGVVDGDGKVHGIANLFVAGSAVFPTYGASNPTLNLIALTLRLADHLNKVAT